MTTISKHPLEAVFSMEFGTMNLDDKNEMIELPQAQLPAVVEDDQEDIEIAGQIGEIYGKAMTAYENQVELTEICEPRYAARNAEVANAILNTALNAVALRSKNKIEKRKSGQFVPFGNSINNSNVVVASRNDILEMIAERKRQEAVN